MTELDIKRGYEVLPDNNVRFGIRVINSSDYAISDVEVILDYSETLFVLEGSKVQKLGTIPPAVPRTAKFILKPLGCIHKEEIGAVVIYKDHQWKRHTQDMCPKEVHCVCPFLKEKSVTRADFLALSNSGYLEERGVNFEGISVNKLVDFILHTCKNRLYLVDEFSIENGKIIYLAGDALGEKAYYLLTVVIKEYEGVTQVLLRAASDKKHGLNGFLNEIIDNLRHLVLSAEAREIGIIKKEQVINIIDSVVQRTTFAGGEGAASVNIEGSVVQRTEIRDDGGKRRREEEEEQERLKKQKEEEERARKEREERGKLQKEEEERQRKEKEEQERLRREEEEKKEREEQERLRKEEEEKREREEREKLQKEEEERQRKEKEEQERLQREEEEKKEREEQERLRREEEEKRERERLERLRREVEERLREKKEEQERLAKQSSSIGMEFTLIPAGEFEMGSEEFDDEQPVHKVKINDPFYLGTYPVTQREWKAVMGNNPPYSKGYFKGGALPVENVSWDDVQEFIKKLNEKEGTDRYRLPSEAEWEYACRAGTTTRYSFGDSESKLGDYAWYVENSDDPHPVGKKKPNPYGLYDMHGNVWEWVQDSWHSNYSGAPADGSAWEGDGTRVYGAYRVHRGGSWCYYAWRCRSASRSCSAQGALRNNLGFRLLRSP